MVERTKDSTVAMSLVDYNELKAGDLILFFLPGQAEGNQDKLGYWMDSENSYLMFAYEVEILGEL